jgi:proline iminopeptidase
VRRADDPYFDLTPIRAEGTLEVADGHAVHWLEAGTPEGVPYVDCHGGPGGRANHGLQRMVADGSRMRVVQFDQRGCGDSTPVGGLDHNSLQHTVADMELLREHLGIDRWVVGGLSWGSTVALAYAETHPERTLAVKAGGVWLCRPADTEWWYQGVRRFFPDTWAEFASLVPQERWHDLRGAYHELIFGDDPDLAERAGQSLHQYEETFMHLEAPLVPPSPARGLPYARVFSHYSSHDFFLGPNQLIEDAARLRGIHVSLITGRYDACTTPDGAWDLAGVLDDVDVRIVNVAGHYPTESAIGRALCEQTTRVLDVVAQRGLV